MKKKLFYTSEVQNLKLQCFKLLDVDELTDNAYEIVATNKTTGYSDFVTTNTPQGAIALADHIRDSALVDK